VTIREVYIYKCYAYQYQVSSTTDKRCWATYVKNTLFCLGFGEAWLSQGVGNPERFLSEFKFRTKVIDSQEWSSALNESRLLRTYRTFKNELSNTPEWYLSVHLPRKMLHYITRLRGGLLRIGVNEDRWRGIEYKNRICKFCSSGEIDDEVHFIYQCKPLSAFRLPLLNFKQFQRHSNNPFDILFKHPNSALIETLYYFIHRSLTFRDEIMSIL